MKKTAKLTPGEIIGQDHPLMDLPPEKKPSGRMKTYRFELRENGNYSTISVNAYRDADAVRLVLCNHEEAESITFLGKK